MARIVVFSSSLDDPAQWRELIDRSFPALSFQVWPAVSDASSVEYALIFDIARGALATFPNLRAVLSLGAGVDQILSDPDFPKDVPVFRLLAPSLADQMAEYALFAVLSAHRDMHRYREQQATRIWKAVHVVPAAERRVGVMGLGRVGSAIVRRLSQMGFAVRGWSRAARSMDGVECYAADRFDAFLSGVDILVNALPLTEETREILNRQTFAKLRRGAHIVNIGRGAHLIEADLLAALDDGTVGGAVLDVFNEEPLPDSHPFWSRRDVLVTPHVAAQANARDALASIRKSLTALENGEVPDGLIIPAKGY